MLLTNEKAKLLIALSKKIVEANRTRDTSLAPITMTAEDQRAVLWAACLVEGNNVMYEVKERS